MLTVTTVPGSSSQPVIIDALYKYIINVFHPQLGNHQTWLA